MKKSKIAAILIGGAINGALGASILVWPEFGKMAVGAIGLVTMAVAAYTGISLSKEA
jgi:hypothetical protein